MGAVWRGDGFGQILCLSSSLNWKRKLYNLHFLFSSLNLSDKAYFCKVIVHTHLDKMIAEYKEQIQNTHIMHIMLGLKLKKRNLQNQIKKGWLLWSLARLMLTTQVVGCSSDTQESDEVT